MDMLRKRFPHSLENDVLFSNSCWEYTVIWNKLPEVGLSVISLFTMLTQLGNLGVSAKRAMWNCFKKSLFK